jgi:hypothetical protein
LIPVVKATASDHIQTSGGFPVRDLRRSAVLLREGIVGDEHEHQKRSQGPLIARNVSVAEGVEGRTINGTSFGLAARRIAETMK